MSVWVDNGAPTTYWICLVLIICSLQNCINFCCLWTMQFRVFYCNPDWLKQNPEIKTCQVLCVSLKVKLFVFPVSVWETWSSLYMAVFLNVSLLRSSRPIFLKIPIAASPTLLWAHSLSLSHSLLFFSFSLFLPPSAFFPKIWNEGYMESWDCLFTTIFFSSYLAHSNHPVYNCQMNE